MELIKVKYIGEGTKIRTIRMWNKIEVNKWDTLEVEKDNLDFFTRNKCIELKESPKPIEVEKKEVTKTPKKKNKTT